MANESNLRVSIWFVYKYNVEGMLTVHQGENHPKTSLLVMFKGCWLYTRAKTHSKTIMLADCGLALPIGVTHAFLIDLVLKLT
jgi:hypothetical protein